MRTSLRLPFGTYQLAKFFFNYHVSGVKLEISNRGFHFFAILKNPLTIYKNLCNWETNFYIRYINKKRKKESLYLRTILRGWLVSTRGWRGCLSPRRSSGWWYGGWSLEFLGELSKALGLFAPGAGRGLFATSSSAPAPSEPVQSVHCYHCWFLHR